MPEPPSRRAPSISCYRSRTSRRPWSRWWRAGRPLTDRAQPDRELDALLEYLKNSRAFDLTGYKRSTVLRRITKRMQQVEIGSFAELPGFPRGPPRRVRPALRHRPHQRHVVLPRCRGVDRHRAGDPPGDPGQQGGQRAHPRLERRAARPGKRRTRWRCCLRRRWEPRRSCDGSRSTPTDVDDERHRTGPTSHVHGERRRARGRGTAQAVLPEGRGPVHVPRRSEAGDHRRPARPDPDAPISSLDLLACRNTLIYFNAETQARILARFHFALKNRGFLFLGKGSCCSPMRTCSTPSRIKHARVLEGRACGSA